MSGNQALIKLHTISGARGLTDPKLILKCVKKALGVDLSPPAASSSELARGVPLLASGERGLIPPLGTKFCYYIESWSRSAP